MNLMSGSYPRVEPSMPGPIAPSGNSGVTSALDALSLPVCCEEESRPGINP